MNVIPIEDPRLTAFGLFSEVNAGLTERMYPTFTKAGLSEVEFDTLIRLARSPGGSLRMGDLAAQTGLSTSGVTRVVDRMERNRLVSRKSSSTDRRASYAAITETGMSRLEGVLPNHLEDIESSLTSLLTQEQLDAFLSTLRIIRDVVRPGALAGTNGQECADRP